MDARDGDTEPFAALLGAYWLLPDFGDDDGADVREHASKRLTVWNGRLVIVAIAVTTVILAVVSVVVREIPG